VQALEGAVIDAVAGFGIEAYPRRDAPGVYVEGRKLAAVGLRVRRGCSYHGIAINVAMDLGPYERIHPCGFDDLEVTQLASLTAIDSIEGFRPAFERALIARLQPS
jgi:lipoyl(octanoyl) transferase